MWPLLFWPFWYVAVLDLYCGRFGLICGRFGRGRFWFVAVLDVIQIGKVVR